MRRRKCEGMSRVRVWNERGGCARGWDEKEVGGKSNKGEEAAGNLLHEDDASAGAESRWYIRHSSIDGVDYASVSRAAFCRAQLRAKMDALRNSGFFRPKPEREMICSARNAAARQRWRVEPWVRIETHSWSSICGTRNALRSPAPRSTRARTRQARAGAPR